MAQSQTSVGGAGCDPHAALARLGDDADLYREVLERFFNDAPNFLERMIQARESQRSDELHRAAHSFKGLAAMAGAEEVARTAAELEAQGKGSRFDEASESLSRLRQQIHAAATILAPHYK
jgi:HPt (histidine-containing phosphotransfer) domain-containing protein